METFYCNYCRENKSFPSINIKIPFIMKKVLFFVVFVFVSVLASAQTFSPVAKVAKEKKSFVAYDVDGSSVGITAAQYLELKDSGVGDYKIVSYKGKDAKASSSFRGVISNKEYTRELFTVDSVSVQPDGVMVMFTNGKTYVAKSLLWADVLKGQSVVHTVIKSSLRNFEKYEALASAPVDFVENHGLQQTPAASKQNPLAKVESFIEPKTSPKTKTYSYGNIKIIEE